LLWSLIGIGWCVAWDSVRGSEFLLGVFDHLYRISINPDHQALVFFVINCKMGGLEAEGLPKELKETRNNAQPILLSLSDLTFTHKFARLVLIEQIYRATEIRKGSGYHK
jgi:Predicted SPOUT methyltransferase